MITQLYRTDKWLVWLAVCASLLLSAWANISDDIINNDGIEYLKSAEAILRGDWSAAVATYKWPFYSLCIASVSTLTNLSLTLSAYVVNAIFNTWVVLAFIALVRLLGGDRNTLWFAALVILAYPTINKYRPYLIRDPAFLALFLSACYAFFLYVRDGFRRHNLMAILLFGLATFFRLEGLIYLFLTQGYLFGRHLETRRGRVLGLVVMLLLLLVLVVFVSWWQFTSTDQFELASLLADPMQFFETTWGRVADDLDFRIRVIEEHILVGYSRSYAVLLLGWSAASIVLLELIHSLYYLYFILWFVAWRMRLLFPVSALYAPWRFLVLATLPLLLGFVLVQWFLTTRYMISLALLILLATPFLLAYLQRQVRQRGRHRFAYGLILVLIVLSGLKSLDLSTKKHYLKAAADWMTASLPAQAQVYTNNRILGHYYEGDIEVKDYWEKWRFFMTDALYARDNSDYGAFVIKPGQAEFIEALERVLRRRQIAVFVNEKGARVVIYDFSQRYDKQWPEPVLVE